MDDGGDGDADTGGVVMPSSRAPGEVPPAWHQQTCAQLCDQLIDAIDRTCEHAFAPDTNYGAVGIEASVHNYNLMYHLLLEHDEQFHVIHDTLSTAIFQNMQREYARHCASATVTCRILVDFVHCCQHLCQVLQVSFDPYNQFIALHHYEDETTVPRAPGVLTRRFSIASICAYGVREYLTENWSHLSTLMRAQIVQYRQDVMASLMHNENPKFQSHCLYISCMRHAAQVQDRSLAAEAADKAERACAHFNDLDDDDAMADDDDADLTTAPDRQDEDAHSHALFIPHMLKTVHAYAPHHTEAFISHLEKHCFTRATAMTNNGGAEAQDVDPVPNDTMQPSGSDDESDDEGGESDDAAPPLSDLHLSLRHYCHMALSTYYVDWRSLFVLHCALAPDAGIAARHTYRARMLKKQRRAIMNVLQRNTFDDVLQACHVADAATLQHLFKMRDCLAECIGMTNPSAQPRQRTHRHRQLKTTDAWHFRQELRQRVLAITGTRKERAGGDDVGPSSRDQSDARVLYDFTLRTTSMCTLVNASGAAMTPDQLYGCHEEWFQAWCRDQYLQHDGDNPDWQSFVATFEEHFFVVWLEEIMRQPLSFVEEHIQTFCQLLRRVPSKDIFVEIYMRVVRHRFLHDRFHAAMDCLVHLQLEHVIGVHPLLHQYQLMISEQHFPPLCWDGMTGRVLARANWKEMPYDATIPVHPTFADRLAVYDMAYTFNHPDRELTWVLFYSKCQLRLHWPCGGGDTTAAAATDGKEEDSAQRATTTTTVVTCSMMIGNILLHMVSSEEGSQSQSPMHALQAAGFGIGDAHFWCAHLAAHQLLVATTSEDTRAATTTAAAPLRAGLSDTFAWPSNHDLPSELSVTTPSRRRYDTMLARQARAAQHHQERDSSDGGSAAEDGGTDEVMPPDATEYQVKTDRSHAVRARIAHVLKHAEHRRLHVDALFAETRAQTTLFPLTREVFDEQLERILEMEYARRGTPPADETADETLFIEYIP